MSLGQLMLLYLLIGVAVAVAVYLSASAASAGERWFQALTAPLFWPLYLPVLLTRDRAGHADVQDPAAEPPADELAAAIGQVDAELEGALRSLDGWAEDVLAREKDRLHELRNAWTAQAERIREMDRLLSRPEYTDEPASPSPLVGEGRGGGNDRLQLSRDARRQNIERLRQVRQRTYEDLMGTLAWVRELVSMIHLAKFTGAPASRAEELVAQIAAAVEGLSALTWQEEAVAGDALVRSR